MLHSVFSQQRFDGKTDFLKSLNLVDGDLKPRLVIKSGHYILPSKLYRLNILQFSDIRKKVLKIQH